MHQIFPSCLFPRQRILLVNFIGVFKIRKNSWILRKLKSHKTRILNVCLARQPLRLDAPSYDTGNESVPIQLAQCWFPGLAIASAKMFVYFSNEIYRSNFIKPLGKYYGLNLQKCWLQFKKSNFSVSFVIIIVTLSLAVTTSLPPRLSWIGSSSSSSFICSNQLNKKTHTWSTREQEQDKKGTENWRLHFAHIKKQKKQTHSI